MHLFSSIEHKTNPSSGSFFLTNMALNMLLCIRGNLTFFFTFDTEGMVYLSHQIIRIIAFQLQAWYCYFLHCMFVVRSVDRMMGCPLLSTIRIQLSMYKRQNIITSCIYFGSISRPWDHLIIFLRERYRYFC